MQLQHAERLVERLNQAMLDISLAIDSVPPRTHFFGVDTSGFFDSPYLLTGGDNVVRLVELLSAVADRLGERTEPARPGDGQGVIDFTER